MGEQQQVQVQVQVQVQQPPHLKCPRCDSSNTKFCYYNNYSLSQPRHLCKSCKRYWTRGGTLRNVPVGGKCKKNKICRDTKQSSTSSSISISSSSSSASMAILAPVKPSTITTVQSSLSLPSSSSTTRTHINNPLFSKRDIGKDLSSFPQFCLDGDELGFLTSQNLPHNLKPAAGGDDTNVVAISNQVFSGNYPLFGINSSTTSTTASTSSTLMASTIIASNLEQQNLVIFNGFKESAAPQPQTQTPYGFLDLDDVQMTRNIDEDFRLAKYAKLTEGHWTNQQNYVEEMKFSSDPHPPFMWNSSAAWLDSSNMGSSVPSLI